MEEKTKNSKEDASKQKEKLDKTTKPTQKDDASKKSVKTLDKKNLKKEAVVNGKNLHISTKYAVAVCNFIRNKEIERSLLELEEVLKKKKAVPVKGEIAHKKGMMSGKYATNTVSEFIKLLKSLKGNALNNELEFEKYKIACKADKASRPMKRFGSGRAKRSHVTIKLIQKDQKW